MIGIIALHVKRVGDVADSVETFDELISLRVEYVLEQGT
jgi:hypothetical protein